VRGTIGAEEINVPAIVSNQEIENCLRETLEHEGFSLSRKRAHGETGVDIKATRGEEQLFIESVGYKESAPARAKDFYEGFFRTVSRLDDGATRCVLAPVAQSGSRTASAGKSAQGSLEAHWRDIS
jgi:hypothetical protein